MMNQPLKRSKLGIASLLIAIGIFLVASVAVVIAFMISEKHLNGVGNKIGEYIFYGFIFGAPAAHFVGLILGIAALFQSRSGKGFAVFGIILNILFPASAVLAILGLISIISVGPR